MSSGPSSRDDQEASENANYDDCVSNDDDRLRAQVPAQEVDTHTEHAANEDH
jgi:hypothetical protein